MNNSPEATPLISVVIPIYNGEKTLIHTLSSVLKQTYPYIEIIVVDDGSEIPVESFLDQGMRDNRICVYRTNRSNANMARNYGISKSKGAYIAMLDADDYWLENHLQDCLNLLQTSHADGLYGSIFMQYGAADGKAHKDRIFYARKLKQGESVIDYLLSTGCGAQTSTLFTTTQSMTKIAWDPSLIDHQDYDFVTRFFSSYTMVAKTDPSVIYSLSSGRKSHYESCIRFVEKNMLNIDPNVYTRYNKNMYVQAMRNRAPENFIIYFQKEAERYNQLHLG
jgi:glycosyltransferase involved in cell wall biosynthesis